MAATVGVGMIGLGTVGSAVARRLIADWEMLGARAGAIPALRRVAVRDPHRARDVELPNVMLDADPEGLVDDPAVDVVVELMGGVDRAPALIERALRAGKPVVTANKAAIAMHGLELAEIAAERGVSLRYEAAVGAGIPVVAVLRDSLRGDRVFSVEMIINGTTNVILSRMESDGLDFAAALREAQARGFAEADPSADVDGHDSAAKLVLLSRLAFDRAVTIGDVEVTGIAAVDAVDIACADSMDASLKLLALGRHEDGRVTLSVRPTVVVAGHPLYGVDGAENAVLLHADLAGSLCLRGPGAGGKATASAVVGDVVQTLLFPRTPPPPPGGAAVRGEAGDVERGGYLRVRLSEVDNAPDLVTQAIEDRGLVVEAATVLAGAGGRPAELAVLTGSAPRHMLLRAAETLDSLAAVQAVVTVLDCTGA